MKTPEQYDEYVQGADAREAQHLIWRCEYHLTKGQKPTRDVATNNEVVRTIVEEYMSKYGWKVNWTWPRGQIKLAVTNNPQRSL
jgi:hypothetical protein